MADNQNKRLVLLNHVHSTSITKAPNEHAAPIHGFGELLEVLVGLCKTGAALEYLSGDATKPAEFLRIKEIKTSADGAFGFSTFLLEHADPQTRSFPVVDINTFEGRDLEGKANERGAVTAHVAIRYPLNGSDQGAYRCVIEHVPPISRRLIGLLFSRLIRNQCKGEEWNFPAKVGKGKKAIEKTYEYYPKLEFVADIGRSFGASWGDRELLSVVFVKKSERHSIGEPSTVRSKEEVCDVEYRLWATQGPTGAAEKKMWFRRWIDDYKQRGFTTKLYFRGVRGGSLSGSVHADVAGAMDLVMCPKETILLGEEPRRWHGAIQEAIASQLRALLSNDALWRQSS